LSNFINCGAWTRRKQERRPGAAQKDVGQRQAIPDFGYKKRIFFYNKPKEGIEPNARVYKIAKH